MNHKRPLLPFKCNKMGGTKIYPESMRGHNLPNVFIDVGMICRGNTSVPLPLFVLRKGDEKPGNVFLPEEGEEALEMEDNESFLICLTCGRVITSQERKIQGGGRHAHTFFNPHGIVFELGCFSSAPGCICRGGLTDEFSWFKGYSWEFALCGDCGEHLGWHYLSGDNGFFGLILNKIGAREMG
jgi:hypothetical protein